MRYAAGHRCRKGITLIMVAAVLSILAAMATAFYTLMLMQTKSAMRYSDSVRAEMLARGGIELAIARLRELCFNKTEDPTDAWFPVDYLNGAASRVSLAADLSANNADDDGDGIVDNPEERATAFSGVLGSSSGHASDRFSLTISDTASRINVNAGDNLAVLLDNLCRVIGPPLAPANADLLQPRRWFIEGAGAALYDKNKDDTAARKDLYFSLGADRRPATDAAGRAIYGDGYAIAGYRSRHGRFRSFHDVKDALTYVERNGNGTPDLPLEMLEIEVKFAALRPYITTDSWVDTSTVCVGKFEWVQTDTGAGKTIAIDRDKSWIASVGADGKDIVDPLNARGSLVGCYVSIVNNHGAGQLRRIKRNGIDWVEIEHGFTVDPGPISSYMIIAREDALTETLPGVTPITGVPQTKADGTFVDDPSIDYKLRPLCIHRAPININTASDKVLAALFLGLNVQHGHPTAVGTDADLSKLRELDNDGNLKAAPPAGGWANPTVWKCGDYANRQHMPYLLTITGMKRTPLDSGKLILDRPAPWPAADETRFAYIGSHGNLGAPDFIQPAAPAPRRLNEAHELAYRIITARQRAIDPATGLPTTKADPDPLTGYEKSPFKSWDDVYVRVVKPWDDERLDPAKNPAAGKKISVARLIMANLNSNADVLKFNPNIEWIDRWGRNFTELEPTLVYDDKANGTFEPVFVKSTNSNLMFAGYPADNFGANAKGAYYARTYRYKPDELIDKTDLNRSTTECIFDSGGIFEIACVGQIMNRGEAAAERRLEALVKVYDVWRESTQRQFAQGSIHAGPSAPPCTAGTDYAGQVARHAGAGSASTLSPLTTWPEPLVPLNYKIVNPNGLNDYVCSTHYNAWGQNKTAGVPDAIANRVQPAGWDGQIALAANTTAFDPQGADLDTFLASFNGDLDTEKSLASGREQAKTPRNKKYRVLDTFSLLGLLNDTQVDFDPQFYDVFATSGGSTTEAKQVFAPLDQMKYWHNVMCRMGDLRPEGVFLGNVGTSGNDGTLKYLALEKGKMKTGPRNYDPFNEQGQGTGHLVCMWFKPTWHADDHIEHEFFNATGKGTFYGARYNNLVKYGQYSWACPDTGGRGGSGGGEHQSDNCLAYVLENAGDADWKSYLHGGTHRIPYPVRESPSFHVQPFRWGFVGGRGAAQASGPTGGRNGWTYSSSTYATRDDFIANRLRPFISTARDPEGSTFDERYYWCQADAASLGTTSGQGNDKLQSAAWTAAPISADSDGSAANTHCFGANNLNQDRLNWLYRGTPFDGTMAVVDEYRLTRQAWTTARIGEEMTKSRYYLPPNPADRRQCPQFVSQSLLQSIRGFDKTKAEETVTLARVSWTVFTPRFGWEAKQAARIRNEIISKIQAPAKFAGPFDYIQYNHDVLPSDGEVQFNPLVKVLSVDRPTPADYKGQAHATKGVEIELLDAEYPDATTAPIASQTFTDPDVFNSIGTAAAPIKVKISRLRYRVRFRYPFDPLVAQHYSLDPATVTPADYYLLDTPVFDDISITYFVKPRFLSCREVME